MKIGKWTAWVGVAVLVMAVLSDWSQDAQHENASQGPAAKPHATARLQPVDRLPKIDQTAPQASASGGELPHHKEVANASVVKAMGPTPTLVAATESAVQSKRQQGASDDEIYRFRAATYSAEKATLLAEMERAEIGWSIRVQSYLAEKARLSNSSDTTLSADQSIALQQLRNSRFTAEEQELLTAREPSSAPQLILQPE